MCQHYHSAPDITKSSLVCRPQLKTHRPSAAVSVKDELRSSKLHPSLSPQKRDNELQSRLIGPFEGQLTPETVSDITTFATKEC